MNKITQKIITANKSFRESKAFGNLTAAVTIGLISAFTYGFVKDSQYQIQIESQKTFQKDKKDWEEFKFNKLQEYGLNKSESDSILPINLQDSLMYFENKCYEVTNDDLDDIKDTNRKIFFRNKAERLEPVVKYLEETQTFKKNQTL